MIRRVLVLIVLVLVATSSPSRAQTVTVAANAADLQLGPVLIFTAQLDQGRRFGYLAYIAFLDAYAVLVAHPTRSGPGGMVATPGLCIEPIFTLPPGSWWQLNGNRPVDGDGDGDDDLVLQETESPYRFRVLNLDLVACR